MDQIATLEFGQYTQLASMELELEGTESAGACDPVYSCDLCPHNFLAEPEEPIVLLMPDVRTQTLSGRA